MTDLYRYRDGVYTTQEEHISDLDEITTHELDVVLRWLEWHSTVEIIYTSVFRPDDEGSPHQDGRAADVRIYHQGRGIQWGSVGCGLDRATAESIAHDLNTVFKWERPTAIIHGEGLNLHMHIQVPDRPWR